MFAKMDKAGGTFTGVAIGVTPAAGAGGYASYRFPHGVAPTTNITNGDVWTTTAGLFGRINGTTQQFAMLSGGTFTGPVITVASGTGAAGFNIPAGTAPTSPNNGDLWLTAEALNTQIDGAAAAIKPGACIAGMAYGTVSGGVLTTVFTSGVITGLALSGSSIDITRTAASGATDWAPLAINAAASALVFNYVGSTQTTTTGSVTVRSSVTGSGVAPAAFMIIVFDKV